jgi:hypothetical protein
MGICSGHIDTKLVSRRYRHELTTLAFIVHPQRNGSAGGLFFVVVLGELG